MNVGVFSGSFNPIHIGHLVLANYITEFTDIDEVWFLVTPQNPMKGTNELADEDDRLEMVKLALDSYPKLVVSDFEFTLPKPSYSISTLDALKKVYPTNTFSLIIGADNWAIFDRWKDFEAILADYKVYVYPRLDYRISIPKKLKTNVEAIDSPIIEISSTFVRECLKLGKDMQAFVPTPVYKYIRDKKLYQQHC